MNNIYPTSDTKTADAQTALESLFDLGVAFDLDAFVFAGVISIPPEKLGYDDNEIRTVVSYKGNLIPPNEKRDLLRIASRCRRLVELYSTSLGPIRSLRYVPNNGLSTLVEKLKELQIEFFEEVDNLVFKINWIKATHLPVVRRAIYQAAKTSEAAEIIYQTILDTFPGPDDIRNKCSVKWNMFSLAGAKSEEAARFVSEETGMVTEIIRSMVEEIRMDLAEKVNALLNGLMKGGKLSSATVNAAQEAINRVKLLNVMNDRVLNEQIRNVKRIIDLATSNPNGMILDSERPSLVSLVEDVQTALQKSSEEAVREAIEDMTSLGRRKITLMSKKENFNDPKAEVA